MGSSSKKNNNKNKGKTFGFIVAFITVLGSVCIILQTPAQLREQKYRQEDRVFDQLIILDNNLKQNKTNVDIFFAIEKNEPILKPKGKFSTIDLDQYLDDLYSIEDAYDRSLIDKDSFYSWFSDYFERTYNNTEIREYLQKIRTESPIYYYDFETTTRMLINYGKE